MKNNTFLSLERIREIAKDYEVTQSSIYSLYKALINAVDNDDVFEKAFLTDPELSDAILEYAVSIKSSSRIKRNGGSGNFPSDEEIAFLTLCKFGLIEETLDYEPIVLKRS